MPRVPTYDNFQVAPNTQQGKVGVDYSPSQAAIPFKQMEQLGQSVENFGNSMSKIQIDMLQEANQLRVEKAYDDARQLSMQKLNSKEDGFLNKMGVDALMGSDGTPPSRKYLQDFDDQMKKIEEGLSNDAQKSAFQGKRRELLMSFESQALKHEADQYQKWALSVRDGTIATSMNEIGINYNNPEIIDKSVKSIVDSTYQKAKLLGNSKEWADAHARAMTSKAHTVAVTAALEKNDPEYADMYLKKYKDQLEADDLLKVNGLITKEMDQKLGFKVANDVMAGVVTKMNTSDFDRVTNITFDTESGNRQFDSKGSPIVSTAGLS